MGAKNQDSISGITTAAEIAYEEGDLNATEQALLKALARVRKEKGGDQS